jgi:hypothetical protein
MSHVFVVDTDTQPLTPVHPGRARLLLKAGKAAVYRTYPFTIILKRRVEEPRPVPLRLKIDPGARTSGLALVDDARGEVIWAAELTHRGETIKRALDKRRALRRGRRTRRTRYRASRFDNRRRRAGWLPPSLLSRLANLLTWVTRIRQRCHVAALSQELVRFDLQKLANPEIAGIDYQQGSLFGYELKGYLLEKWNRTCAYCKDAPERLARVLAQAKAPLKDATVVNATRWELFRRLQGTGLPVEKGSGGRTKYNRSVRSLPKTHWLDAACVGASTPEQLSTERVFPLLITARGHGRRKMCNTDDLGFPTGHRKRQRRYLGFQTGDLVRAVVPEGFAAVGTHVGRVMVRATGSFALTTPKGRVEGVPHRFCHLIGRNDGYSYQAGARHADPTPIQPKRNDQSSPV